jgi:hypothetical protein
MGMVLVYAAAAGASAIAFPLLLWHLRLSSWRGRLTLALSVLVAGLGGLFWLAYNGLVQALPVTLLVFDFMIINAWYTWAVSDLVGQRADSLLESHPEIKERFQASSVLRRFMKKE